MRIPIAIIVVGVCPQRSYIISCGKPFVNSYFKLFCKNLKKSENPRSCALLFCPACVHQLLLLAEKMRAYTWGTAIDSDHTDAQNTNATMVTCHIPFFSWSAA